MSKAPEMDEKATLTENYPEPMVKVGGRESEGMHALATLVMERDELGGSEPF